MGRRNPHRARGVLRPRRAHAPLSHVPRTRNAKRRGGRDAGRPDGELARRPHRLHEVVHRQGGRAELPGRLRGRAGADRPLMASANLDLVRSIFAAWERGDFTSADWAHPEIEFARADGPDPGVWRGVAGMAGAWRDRAGSFEGFRPEVEEYRELDGERVLVLFRATGRAKASGLDLGQMRAKGANLVHVRDGKVTRLVTYFDRDRALADLGLAPEGASPDTERPG